MVWTTLGSKTAKEQNRTIDKSLTEAGSVTRTIDDSRPNDNIVKISDV